MSRKTFYVSELKESINMKLALTGLNQDKKESLACLLEDILHKTGNYNGYNHNFPWNKVNEEYRKNHDYDRHYY